ncbi:MAG: transposase, partial [Planctomycetota bacterium]
QAVIAPEPAEILIFWLNNSERPTPANKPTATQAPNHHYSGTTRYAQNNWDALNRYTEEDYLNIDNNASERAIKNVVIGRKNWLFAGSETGGHIAAVCYTLIKSAKRARANPEAWLNT